MLSFHDINTMSLLAVLLDATVKGLVLIVFAGCVSRLLRKVSAAGRHTVWTFTVVALLALPILSAVLPQWQIPLLPEWAQYKPEVQQTHEESLMQADPVSIESTGRAGLLPRERKNEFEETPLNSGMEQNGISLADEKSVDDVSRTFQTAFGAVSDQNDSEEVFPAGRINWSVWVIGIWLAGAAVVVLPLMMGTAGAFRQVRRAERVTEETWLGLLESLRGELHLTRPVRLRQWANESIPAVFGVFCPTILIPDGAEQWCENRRRAVLLHELAHVKRRDCLTQLLAQLACVLYWFNPLAWLVARQLRIERERACDDLVLSAGQRPSEYADHLLEMVRTLQSRTCPSLAAVAMAKKSNFEHRLLAILDAARPRKAFTKAATTEAFLVIVAVLLPLAMLHVTTKTPMPQTTIQPSTTTQPTATTQSAAQPESAIQADESLEVQQLRRKKVDVELKLEVAKGRFGPNHKTVTSLETELQAIKKLLARYSKKKSKPVGGTLSFRIAPKNSHFGGPLNEDQVQRYVELLSKKLASDKDGPKGDDQYIWLPVKSGETFGQLIVVRSETQNGPWYILVSNQPKEIMLSGPVGERGWWLNRVSVGKDAFGKPAVSFSFDEDGANRFEKLTAEALKRNLAIIVDDCVWSAPTVMSKIRDGGMITGDFAVKEVNELVRRLKLGMMNHSKAAKTFFRSRLK